MLQREAMAADSTVFFSVDETARRRFELAWREGRPESIDNFLPAADSPQFLPTLEELVHIELEMRWKQVSSNPQPTAPLVTLVSVEEYLRRFPQLGQTAIVFRLLKHEYQIRQRLGDRPSAPEYAQRFPEVFQNGLPITALLSEVDGPSVPQVPGYVILSVLGKGGMGVVYMGRQQSLNRLVAMKMMLNQSDPAGLERFRLEVDTIAQLRHPNIVHIYEVGEYQGKPFYVMEYVEGGTLAQKLMQSLPPVRQAAQWLEALARAIHLVHQQGIVHRDLKPGNILLTADGVPKISDFGLAKNIGPSRRDSNPLTLSGEILGTPSYMAPEQAAGMTCEVGPGTDIFALGAILHELLSGQPPFLGQTPLDTLNRVLRNEPEPPLETLTHVPGDLRLICQTCLRKEVADRYASALELAEDLRAFLAGEPIARRAGPGWNLFHWIRRRPTAALLLGLGGMAGLGLLLGALFYNTLAVCVVAMASLMLGAWWYNARLQLALREMEQQHIRAERNVERLHLLLETTRQLLNTRSLDELLRLLSETTTRMANAERATIFLVDAQKKELWSKVALGDGVGEIRLPLGEGVAGQVALKGQTVFLDDPYNDERFNPEIDRRTGYRTRNLLTLPMKSGDGKILGVFQVLNKRGGSFTREDAHILTALAASAAQAVENANREKS